MNNKIRKDFTMIPNELINSELDVKARFLFVYLCSKPDDWEYRNSQLEKALKMGKDTRIKFTNELIEAGWITVVQKKGENGEWGTNDIELNPYPKKPATVQPSTNFTAAEFYGSGKNPPHSNTDNISNTDSFNNTLFSDGEIEKIEKKELKSMFKNSTAADKDLFAKKFKNEIEAGINMEYYYNAVANWSEIKTGEKRTANGWLATVRTFMQKDSDVKKLKFVQQAQTQSSQSLDAEMKEYLKL